MYKGKNHTRLTCFFEQMLNLSKLYFIRFAKTYLFSVCDDHLIKDDILFYRFRKDDETYMNDKDLVLFYKAQELHNG